MFTTPKSHKPRTVATAPSVLAELKAQRRRQIENQLRAGPMWDNAHNLIFTNATGGPMPQRDIERHFRAVADAAGLEGMRFHDGCIKIGLNQKQPHSKGGTDLVLFLFYNHKGGNK